LTLPDRLAALEATVAGDPRYAHTTNVVVLHHGAVVLDRGYAGGSPDDLVDLYSVTKSVVSALVGVALRRGELASLDLPVYGGPRTFRHLLTMTGGTESDGAWEIDEVLARPAGWRDFLLEAPQLTAPGERFRYDNGAVHLLGCALADAVARPLADYAEEHLFAPLGIDRFDWPADPEGYSYGFGHLRLRPRDLALVGELFRLGGGDLLAPGYAAAATTAQTTGGGPEHAGYGYLWWVGDGLFFGGGYAGQALLVLPEHELVAVAAGTEELLRPGWRNARHAVEEALAA
jgi:CubicO group peptidase (beta-lactamase class C family)